MWWPTVAICAISRMKTWVRSCICLQCLAFTCGVDIARAGMSVTVRCKAIGASIPMGGARLRGVCALCRAWLGEPPEAR
jgi:hypothetical protein